MDDTFNEIKLLMDAGIYDHNMIFKLLYPSYTGHYSSLRDQIARVKNAGGVSNFYSRGASKGIR
jgi:hypothetical protein